MCFVEKHGLQGRNNDFNKKQLDILIKSSNEHLHVGLQFIIGCSYSQRGSVARNSPLRPFLKDVFIRNSGKSKDYENSEEPTSVPSSCSYTRTNQLLRQSVRRSPEPHPEDLTNGACWLGTSFISSRSQNDYHTSRGIKWIYRDTYRILRHYQLVVAIRPIHPNLDHESSKCEVGLGTVSD